MKERVEEIVKPYEGLALECDGLTRVISYLLLKEEIQHTIKTGELDVVDIDVLTPHYWIILDDTGEIVDYRARMWFGPYDYVPYGVFKEADYPKARYYGQETRLMVNRLYFNILTGHSEETADQGV